MTLKEMRDWAFSILVPEDDDCPVCKEMIHNHDDYTIVVRYPDGDKVNAEGMLYHSKCVSLIHTRARSE